MSHRLALEVYKATSAFPHGERYGLTPQLRRAAVSVPTNIAEGCGRSRDAELRRFFRIAAGSLSEVSYQLLLSSDLGYLEPESSRDLSDPCTETSKVLRAFIDRLGG